jgi:cation diffusion facilitator CzcD-associated flavoprotein CzcO
MAGKLMGTGTGDTKKSSADVSSKDTQAAGGREAMSAAMMDMVRTRVESEVHDPATAKLLSPDYPFFCKRPCFHDTYLSTFNSKAVTLVNTDGEGVQRIDTHGPIVADVSYPVDVLVYATGFEVSVQHVQDVSIQHVQDVSMAYRIWHTGYGIQEPCMCSCICYTTTVCVVCQFCKVGTFNTIVGRDGVRLGDKWSNGISTFLGIHTHGFPNLYIMVSEHAHSLQCVTCDTGHPRTDCARALGWIATLVHRPDLKGKRHSTS